MPTFDFRCVKCNATFEFHRPFGSKVMPACPECKAKKTEKMLSPPAIHFKGAGFYKTDTRSSAASKKKEAEKKPDETPAASASAATESPAAQAPKTSPQSPKKGV